MDSADATGWPRTTVLGRLDRWLAGLTEIPAAVLVAVEILVLLAGVISRYVFNSPLTWSDELASILFLWLAMLGAVIALRRVERLFCKNERAVLQTTAGSRGDPVTLVLVAAVLVASIRLHFLDVLLNLKHRGPNVIACDARFRKGDELGWFQHGSTIIVFAPDGFAFCDNVREGAAIQMGQPLLRLP